MRMPLPQFSAWLPSGFHTVMRGVPALVGQLEDAVGADAEVRGRRCGARGRASAAAARRRVSTMR